MKTISYTVEEIWEWLEVVKDPEIPVLSLTDMGVITEVQIEANGKVIVKMTPTFTGCPAIDAMKKGVEETLAAHQVSDFEVSVSFEIPWSSDRLTDRGREALSRFGLAPPPIHRQMFDIDILDHIVCPNCGSDNTVMRSPFGPTLCRSLHYCQNCKQGFEQFKPL